MKKKTCKECIRHRKCMEASRNMICTSFKEMDEELQKAIGNAWSFPGLNPPPGSVYLGDVENKKDTTYYYKCCENYLFDTEKGRKFAAKMEEVEKRMKRKRMGLS